MGRTQEILSSSLAVMLVDIVHRKHSDSVPQLHSAPKIVTLLIHVHEQVTY